jgi:Pectate lyase superfamily protein
MKRILTALLAVGLPVAACALGPASAVNIALETGAYGTNSGIALRDAINPVVLGADPTGSTDSTAAIQSAITQAKNQVGGKVHLPAGQYLVSSLNLTNLSGLAFEGDGVNVTRINPTSSSGVVMDLTGSSNVTLKGFQIGYYNQSAVPKAAILLAQVASGSSTEILFEDIYVSGSYSVATLYDYGVPSSHFLNSRFYNYDSAAVPTVYLTQSNAASVTSAFSTITTGNLSTSDLTFTGCEIHDFTQNSGAGTVWLDGANQISWFGGNISCYKNGPAFVNIKTSSTGLSFHGVTFYADSGSVLSDMFLLAASQTATNVEVTGGLSQASSTLFAAGTGATYDTLTYVGKAGGATNVLGSGSAITVINSSVTCDGSAVNIGSGTISHSILFHPGTITAGTDSSTHI